MTKNNKLNILLLGSGAREHALHWKLSQSNIAGRITQWPRTPPGFVSNQSRDSVNLPTEDASMSELADFAENTGVDIVVVGPEAPLAAGIAGELKKRNIACFGPSKFCAQLETSKEISKTWMVEAGVPTAAFASFRCHDKALAQAKKQFDESGSVVIKASGLAGGKGVFVCDTAQQVEAAFLDLKGRFASASEVIVVEEKLVGRECSFFCFVGEQNSQPIAIPIGFAVDFKRLHDSDQGPNTGGMGCYTPVPWLPEGAKELVLENIVHPTLKHMKNLGHTYHGFLYVGLMWTAPDKPKVIEFNCRLGDPEAQAIAISDERDWLEIIAVLQQKASASMPKENKNLHPVVNIVLTSKNYGLKPGELPSELPKEPFPEVFTKQTDSNKPLQVFFGGISRDEKNRVFPKGGRVASLCFKAPSLEKCREGALSAAEDLQNSYWPSVHFRKDIAERSKESLDDFLKSLET